MFKQADFVRLKTESIVGSSQERGFCIKMINKKLFEFLINEDVQKLSMNKTIQLEDMDFRGNVLKLYRANAFVGLDKVALFYSDDGTGILNPFMLHIYSRYVKNINEEVLIQYRVN